VLIFTLLFFYGDVLTTEENELLSCALEVHICTKILPLGNGHKIEFSHSDF